MWTTVREKVRQRSRTTEVMLAGAIVRAVEGDTLVLSHESAPLAKRLVEQRNSDVIREALKDALGVDWKIRCEAGAAAPAAAAPEPDSVSPSPLRRDDDEEDMLAEAGNDTSEAPRRDPEEAALELLQNELGARPYRRQLGLGRPPRPQRQTTVVAVRIQLDRQNLVQLNDIRLKAQSRARHVQAPHLGGGQPDLFDRLVPVFDEVAAPVAQRQRVVVAKVLLVYDFQADVLRLGDDAAGAGELPVREDVAVDEAAGTRRPSGYRGG